MSITVVRAGDVAAEMPTDLIMLWGFIGTDGNVTHLRQPFVSAGYQVTGGKTLYLARIKVTGTGTAGWWKLGYADNDVGMNTTTARTNGVMGLGVDDVNNNGLLLVPQNITSVGVALPQDTQLWKLAIATKFPFLRRVGATPNDTVCVWGFEL